jgi:hypothetical protein
VSAVGPREPVVLAPGYRPDPARLRGWPLVHHPEFARSAPGGWRGARTLLTRIEPDGSAARGVLPIAIHHVAVAPDRRRASVSSLEGESFLLLDLAELEVEALLAPHAEGFVGGGHAVWSNEEAVVSVTERRMPGPFSGDPAAHEGRVVVRDGGDGRVLAVWPSGGIGPHDIAPLPDGRTLAVAHWGWPDMGEARTGPRHRGSSSPRSLSSIVATGGCSTGWWGRIAGSRSAL